MKKQITLSKEQAKTLYNLLTNHEVPNRSDNRKRFKFIGVFEDFAFEYDDQLDEFIGKSLKEAKDAMTKLGKETKDFIFPDREVFSKVKDMFEKCFETGTIEIGANGQKVRSPLMGRDAKVYTELEDRFADVKDLKENKK